MTTTTTTTGLAPIPASDAAHYRVADLAEIAERCAASKLFGMDASQTFTLMIIAQAEGLHPAEALKRYHVIEGRPAMRADAMQAEFTRRGGQLRWLETSAERVAVEAWHPVLHPEHLTFHLSMAELVESRVACRWDRDKRQWTIKDMYRKYPRQMLRARAVSELVRAIDPGTVVGVYTPEEILDSVAEERAARFPLPAPAPDRAPPPSAPPGPSGRGGGASPPQPSVPRPWKRPRSPSIAPGPGDSEDVEPEWKDFIRRECKGAHDDLDNALKLAGKPPAKDPVCTGFQTVNWLCSTWIEEQSMEAADIAGPNGKRDRNLANEAVAVAYARSPEEVRADIRAYVAHKLADALRDAGLEVPNDPDGDGDDDAAQATADEDPLAPAAPSSGQ